MARSIILCSIASAVAQDRPLAPSQPTQIQCSPAGDAVLVRCNADAASTDVVDFGFARTDDGRNWMSVHHVVQVGADGVVTAMVKGLLPGAEYRVTARAHHGGSSEGWNEKWSAMTEESALCTAPSQKIAANADDSKSVSQSTWLEVFRYRGPGYGKQPGIKDFHLPDFLDGHNSGDANKQLSRWDFPGSVPGVDFNEASYSRYCVEILNVELHPRVHLIGSEGPTKQSLFSNYLPCDGGKCHCPYKFDAFTLEAELNTERSYVDANCPGTSACACDAELGANYTGRWSFSPPFTDSAWMTGDGTPMCGWRDHQYPCHSDAGPKGYWYHHPEAARCRDDAEIGTAGCTWKRSPLVHTLSVQQLLDAGSIGRWPMYRKMSIEEEMHSVQQGLQAFAAVGAKPCGPNAAVMFV